MRQWESIRAARLGPASPGKRDAVHGHIGRSRNGRFESRGVNTDQKRQVEIVIPNYRVSIGQTAEVEVDLAVHRRSHTDRRIGDREAPARDARSFAIELEPLDVKLMTRLESPVE